MKCFDTNFVDFLQRCFIWEPEKRITPKDALKHKWIQEGTEEEKSINPEDNKRNNCDIKKEKVLNKTLGLSNNLFKAKEDKKSQDKLMKFKEVLKLAKKQVKGNESRHMSMSKESGNKMFLYTLFNKTKMPNPSSTKHKELKQSNIF